MPDAYAWHRGKGEGTGFESYLDRTQAFGFNDKLSYQVIANLAMAQHRSQGSYQMLVGRWTSETFRRFALDAPDAVARTDELFRRLAEPQWPAVEYDEHGELIEAR